MRAVLQLHPWWQPGVLSFLIAALVLSLTGQANAASSEDSQTSSSTQCVEGFVIFA